MIDFKKYRCKYECNFYVGRWVHSWTVVGRDGAVQLNITDLGHNQYGDRYVGGIEFHWRVPPDYMKNDAPHHSHCHVLETPCWHDGSSLQVTEIYIPYWLADQNDHERMLLRVIQAYDEQLTRTL